MMAETLLGALTGKPMASAIIGDTCLYDSYDGYQLTDGEPMDIHGWCRRAPHDGWVLASY